MLSDNIFTQSVSNEFLNAVLSVVLEHLNPHAHTQTVRILHNTKSLVQSCFVSSKYLPYIGSNHFKICTTAIHYDSIGLDDDMDEMRKGKLIGVWLTISFFYETNNSLECKHL